MTKIVNLTPHTVNLHPASGPAEIIRPTGTPARVSVSTEPTGDTFAGVPVVIAQYGNVTGLPAPVPGTVYIVSRLVAAACPDRHDLVVPTDLVRDEAGRIIGCRALEIINP